MNQDEFEVVSELPLFPLRAVLFSGGRLPLQIFEPRYLTLVSESLKHQRSFGLIWLRSGSEVELPGAVHDIQPAEIGVEARIVNWGQLENGHLSILVEGGRRFRLRRHWQQSNHQYAGEVEWLAESEPLPLELRDEGLKDLLFELLQHPHMQSLGIKCDGLELGALTNTLGQILPLAEEDKYQLLWRQGSRDQADYLHSLLAAYEE